MRADKITIVSCALTCVLAERALEALRTLTHERGGAQLHAPPAVLARLARARAALCRGEITAYRDRPSLGKTSLTPLVHDIDKVPMMSDEVRFVNRKSSVIVENHRSSSVKHRTSSVSNRLSSAPIICRISSEIIAHHRRSSDISVHVKSTGNRSYLKI